MAKIGEMIACNPQVKLEKHSAYNLVDIDSIDVGNRYVYGKNPEVYVGQSGCHCQNGDTVMARITPCLENGKIAQVKCETKMAFGSTELFVFRGVPGKTNNDYVYYLMSLEYIRLQAANSMTGASGRQRADLKFIKKIEWEFPSVNDQERIAKALSSYDNLIENNNKRIKILEQMAENLYKEWFVRFRFPGYENAEFVDGLPKGWSRNKLKTYYNTSSGGTPSRSISSYYENGSIPWVKTGEITDTIILGTEEYITEDAVKHSSAKKIASGSLLMAMYGVNIGQLGIVAKEMTCNQAACVFSEKRAFSSRFYLFYYLKSIREYLLLIGFGAAQQNLSQELIQNIRIVMPTDGIVMAFEQKIGVMYDEIQSLLEKNANLVKQRDLLLPRLMNGKLSV